MRMKGGRGRGRRRGRRSDGRLNSLSPRNEGVREGALGRRGGGRGGKGHTKQREEMGWFLGGR